MRESIYQRLPQKTIAPDSALDGFSRLHYDVDTYSNYIIDDQGLLLPTNEQSIWRLDDSGNPIERYATISNGYGIIRPHEFAEMFDEAVPEATIEYMFVLNGGKILGILTKMEPFVVLGDEMNQSLMVINPLDGRTSVRSLLTSIRMHCTNQIFAILKSAEHDLRIRHNEQDFSRNVYAGMKDMYALAKANQHDAQPVMEQMARRHLTDEEALEYIHSVYPMPKKPRKIGWAKDTNAYVDRVGRYEDARTTVAAMREQAFSNYLYSDTHSDATKGTVWGAYNAIVEYEDHIRPGKNDEITAESAVLGIRAERKKSAWRMALGLI